jgi:hypothetical protein
LIYSAKKPKNQWCAKIREIDFLSIKMSAKK